MPTDACSPSPFASPLTTEVFERIRCFDGAPVTVAPVHTPTPPIVVDARLCGPDGTTVGLDAGAVTIGRGSSSAGADLTVADPTVSRHHARACAAGGATLCVDLGSRNGTARRRDGELHPVPGRAGGPTLLLPGDELVTAQGTLLAVVTDDRVWPEDAALVVSTYRLQVREPRGTLHDVFVTAEDTSPTCRLEEEIEATGFRAKPLGVGGRSLASAKTVGDLGLEHGDIVECGRLGTRCGGPGAGTYVVVVAGPDAGRWRRIAPGQRVIVGRDAEGLRIADPLLSARHCTFELTQDEHGNVGDVLVADAGSTNGTFVERDEIVGEPVALERGGYVHAGSSVLTVVTVDDDDLAVLGEPEGGAAVLPRQYRRALPGRPDRLDPPTACEPEKSDHSNMWWRSVLPLVSGAGFALLTGRWIFLLIMALAPLVFTYDALKRHRREGRRHETAHAKYLAELDRYAAELTELRRAERRRRRAATPTGGLAPFEMALRAARLWERAPGDADFLDVAVGLAVLPSGIESKPPEGVTLADLRWGTPVRTNLQTTGSLAIVGEPRAARAAARNIVLGLAATHSPADVRLNVLCDDVDGDEWGFARWLPHTFQGEHGCRIAPDRESRANLFTSISQLLDTRREFAEKDSKKVPLPIHVVIVDDTELLTPEELTELLVHGPAHGIVAITIDERLSPEGAGATLTMPSTDAAVDHCTFQSRHQPRLDEVIVAAIAADVAESAARRIAGLRPTISDEQGIAGGVVHLVDLIESGGALTPDAVRLRWDTIGPRTAVPVGAATGTTMVVDLVRDGPHGLVGGTSGSGKTEFLKTLFCGLALNNHPDDLSIVIVDFKGGVDHEAVKPLPHVIDVATNLDIEQFKRTIVLLKAESMRRQDLLASAGASNVDSYRLARASKPDLPPLPRLLVVVDEFGELLASEGGREQLKELESITRIGRALGLHLLLVTQNFDGNLPAQIDANAGMRVCLRVQKPAHSKAVLDSGVAATIADRNVGRAYARFHGRELIEFQTARVAGRRRDLDGSSTPVTARLVPFSVLSTAPPESRPEDVPVEETDMYVILQSIRAAAEATGWQRSAVPWPASLPERISLLALGGRAPDGVTALGVSDVPEQQRRGLCTFSDRDQQLALLGGTSAPLPEILTTYATALAVGRSPDDLHVYGIDLIGRSLSQLGDLPHCGGVAVRNDNLALRMLRWLTQLVAERKAAVSTSGSSTVWEHAAITGQLPPQIVLLVSGADRLLSTSDGPTSNLLGPLVSLMTEAIGVRVQIVLAGLPKIVAHRLGSNIERRFVFQLADPGEYSGVGAPKSARADLMIPRRAIETNTGRLVQFAQLAAPNEAEGAMVRTIAARLPAPIARPPKLFADITWPMPWAAAPLGALTPPAHMVVPVPVGIDTEDGGWLWIDADDDGPVFSVVGGPRSGRSAALHAIARLAAGQGHAVLNVALARRSPLSTSDDPALGRRVAPGQVAAALAENPGRVVVLYDDLQRLPDSDCIEAAVAERERVLMIVSGAPDFLDGRTGLMRPLPASRAGIVLAPSGNYDGNAVGLKRVPADAMLNPRPGRGLLVVGGEPVPIQLPHVVDGRPSADLSGGLPGGRLPPDVPRGRASPGPKRPARCARSSRVLDVCFPPFGTIERMLQKAQPPAVLPQANEACWCGSGRKYKRCHKPLEGRVLQGVVSPMRTVPPQIARPQYADTGIVNRWAEPRVKSPEIIERMRHAGAVAAEVLRLAGDKVAPGVTTDEIDVYVHELCIERNAYPSPLNYNGYPKSVCTSVNEIICHGIPDSWPLQDGDIVNIDVTTFVGGVHGDTNATFFAGNVDPVSRDLVKVTEECMWHGIEAVVPGRPLSDIGRAIETHAKKHHYGVVRAFIGHSIGELFHGDIQVLHYYDERASMIMRPGMTFTIEPMITLGTWQHKMIFDDDWTAVTADGKRTAQFEHTILVTDDGFDVLTAPGAASPSAPWTR